jgi:hypothetical protein
MKTQTHTLLLSLACLLVALCTSTFAYEYVDIPYTVSIPLPTSCSIATPSEISLQILDALSQPLPISTGAVDVSYNQSLVLRYTLNAGSSTFKSIDTLLFATNQWPSPFVPNEYVPSGSVYDSTYKTYNKSTSLPAVGGSRVVDVSYNIGAQGVVNVSSLLFLNNGSCYALNTSVRVYEPSAVDFHPGIDSVSVNVTQTLQLRGNGFDWSEYSSQRPDIIPLFCNPYFGSASQLCFTTHWISWIGFLPPQGVFCGAFYEARSGWKNVPISCVNPSAQGTAMWRPYIGSNQAGSAWSRSTSPVSFQVVGGDAYVDGSSVLRFRQAGTITIQAFHNRYGLFAGTNDQRFFDYAQNTTTITVTKAGTRVAESVPAIVESTTSISLDNTLVVYDAINNQLVTFNSATANNFQILVGGPGVYNAFTRTIIPTAPTGTITVTVNFIPSTYGSIDLSQSYFASTQSFTIDVYTNGQCGPSARVYNPAEMSMDTSASGLCAKGTPSAIPSLPANGGSTSWTCLGQGGSATNQLCSASKSCYVGACVPDLNACGEYGTCTLTCDGTQIKTTPACQFGSCGEVAQCTVRLVNPANTSEYLPSTITIPCTQISNNRSYFGSNLLEIFIPLPQNVIVTPTFVINATVRPIEASLPKRVPNKNISSTSDLMPYDGIAQGRRWTLNGGAGYVFSKSANYSFICALKPTESFCSLPDGTLVGNTTALTVFTQQRPAYPGVCSPIVRVCQENLSGLLSFTGDPSAIYSTCYRWNVLSSWSVCGANCGNQTRTVVCQDANGNTVSDSMCDSAMPIRTRACPTPCDGICGDKARTYGFYEGSTSVGAKICHVGTANITDFTSVPAGSTLSWTCSGVNGGLSSSTCFAYRYCSPDAGQSCGSSNSCGDRGTIQCDGSCNATTTPQRPGYASPCYASTNACGDAYGGTLSICHANGSLSCNYIAPITPERNSYLDLCLSAPNACGQTTVGQYVCGGLPGSVVCNATTPDSSLCPLCNAGQNAKLFNYTTTAYPSTAQSAFCTVGSVAAIPVFPTNGSSVFYTCQNGAVSQTCSASRIGCAKSGELPNASMEQPCCGTSTQTCDSGVCMSCPATFALNKTSCGCYQWLAMPGINARSFLPTDTEWLDTSIQGFCLQGTPNFSVIPTFPPKGNSISWRCNGTGGVVTYTAQHLGDSCVLPDTTLLTHGSSRLMYQQTNGPCGQVTCPSQSRTCYNGTLTGSSIYNVTSCSAIGQNCSNCAFTVYSSDTASIFGAITDFDVDSSLGRVSTSVTAHVLNTTIGSITLNATTTSDGSSSPSTFTTTLSGLNASQCYTLRIRGIDKTSLNVNTAGPNYCYADRTVGTCVVEQSCSYPSNAVAIGSSLYNSTCLATAQRGCEQWSTQLSTYSLIDTMTACEFACSAFTTWDGTQCS